MFAARSAPTELLGKVPGAGVLVVSVQHRIRTGNAFMDAFNFHQLSELWQEAPSGPVKVKRARGHRGLLLATYLLLSAWREFECLEVEAMQRIDLSKRKLATKKDRSAVLQRSPILSLKPYTLHPQLPGNTNLEV